jgi:hypothetical protein
MRIREQLRFMLYNKTVRTRLLHVALCVQMRFNTVGHDIKDMLVSCRADTRSCDLNDFFYFPNPQYGRRGRVHSGMCAQARAGHTRPIPMWLPEII